MLAAAASPSSVAERSFSGSCLGEDDSTPTLGQVSVLGENPVGLELLASHKDEDKTHANALLNRGRLLDQFTQRKRGRN